jgi:hypothetical protein
MYLALAPRNVVLEAPERWHTSPSGSAAAIGRVGLNLEIEAPPQGGDLEARKMSLLFFHYFNLTFSLGGDFRPLQTFGLRPFIHELFVLHSLQA